MHKKFLQTCFVSTLILTTFCGLSITSPSFAQETMTVTVAPDVLEDREDLGLMMTTTLTAVWADEHAIEHAISGQWEPHHATSSMTYDMKELKTGAGMGKPVDDVLMEDIGALYIMVDLRNNNNKEVTGCLGFLSPENVPHGTTVGMFLNGSKWGLDNKKGTEECSYELGKR